MKLALVSLLFISSLAQANSVTFRIQTTTGVMVDVTESALKEAYSVMIQLDYNNTFKNEDGSTSIVRPAILFAGQQHVVAKISDYGNESARGLCKLRGFATLVTTETGGDASGPTVSLREDGSPDVSHQGPDADLEPYFSITCR